MRVSSLRKRPAVVWQCLRTLVLGLAAVCLMGPAWADPPGRVGRLAQTQGSVWLYSPDNGDWVEAPRNQPLTSGDQLATDAGARAEVQVGSASLRLDGGTRIEVLEIDDLRLRFRIESGSVVSSVRSNESADQIEIDSAEGQFQSLQPGLYRIDRKDEASTASAWSGGLRFVGAGEELTVSPGRRIDIWNDNGLRYNYAAPEQDAFADWALSRERAVAPVAAAPVPYVSPEMTGAQDLVQYGSWQQTADYGSVWIPAAVAVDWAPYRYGRWAWMRPWGWTWVDDAPWGFAPFHYGRWVSYRNRWCWSPGSYVARPVYAPALVAWVGGGPRWSDHDRRDRGDRRGRDGQGPNVGWFPLAPREVYVPGYKVSPHYVRNVNGGQVVSVGDVSRIIRDPNDVMNQSNYINRGNRNAMTIVPQGVLTRREPVGPVAKQTAGVGAVSGSGGGFAQRLTNVAPVTAPVPPPAGKPVAAPPIRIVGPRERPSSPQERTRELAAPADAPAVPAPPVRPPTAMPKVPLPSPQGGLTQQRPVERSADPSEADQRAMERLQQREAQREGRVTPVPPAGGQPPQRVPPPLQQQPVPPPQLQQPQVQQPPPLQQPAPRPPVPVREPIRPVMPAPPGQIAEPSARPALRAPTERLPQVQSPQGEAQRPQMERRAEPLPQARTSLPPPQPQLRAQPQPQPQPSPAPTPQMRPSPAAMPPPAAPMPRPPPAGHAQPPQTMQPAQPPGRAPEQRQGGGGGGPRERENRR